MRGHSLTRSHTHTHTLNCPIDKTYKGRTRGLWLALCLKPPTKLPVFVLHLEFRHSCRVKKVTVMKTYFFKYLLPICFYTQAPMVSLEFPNLTCMFLYCGRKPEPARTPADTGYANSTLNGFFPEFNHCTTTSICCNTNVE